MSNILPRDDCAFLRDPFDVFFSYYLYRLRSKFLHDKSSWLAERIKIDPVTGGKVVARLTCGESKVPRILRVESIISM